MTKRERFRLWHQGQKWDAAEREWDRGAQLARKIRPLKGLKHTPLMAGITPSAARFLKLKSLYYLLRFDEGLHILRKTLLRPLFHLKNYLHSIIKQCAHKREGDFFFYGVDSVEDFSKKIEDPTSKLIVGFSYCQKPHECPSGRFTSDCIRDPHNFICRQCFIGKALNALPLERSVPILIKTVHHIGKKLFEVLETTPADQLFFMITACELTLKMFGDWGNMTGARGIGIRLDGRICNTMRAFELSERGIKPGLTTVLPKTEQRVLDLIRHRRESI